MRVPGQRRMRRAAVWEGVARKRTTISQPGSPTMYKPVPVFCRTHSRSRTTFQRNALTAGILLAVLPMAAAAADDSGDSPAPQSEPAAAAKDKTTTLGSMQVTASKRTTLIKTPMALSAVTAEQLDELGAVDIKD
jgi:outer membrane receptor for ferric coprogen and ferric-rhodotorulic acid